MFRVKHRRGFSRKWTATVAAALLFFGSIFAMPAMAHRAVGGQQTHAAHDAVAQHAAADHRAHHHAHAGNGEATVTVAADAATPPDDGAVTCSLCPFCLAIAAAVPALQIGQRVARVDVPQSTTGGRHRDPAVPPPRRFA